MRLILAGRLDPCFLFSYAVPVERLAGLIPPGLALLKHWGFGFWNVVVCRVRRLRPPGWPRHLGLSFWQVSHRIQVQVPGPEGRPLEGLFFLRSEVDGAMISVVGNMVTDFRFRGARIEAEDRDARFRLAVRGSSDGDADALVSLIRSPASEVESAWLFETPEDRERILRYAPLSVAPDRSGRRLRTARVSRDESSWRESPVAVETMDFRNMQARLGAAGRLVRATAVAPIDYRWELGGRLPADGGDR